MMNISEELPIEERTVVLDRVAQKLCNSGYKLGEIRKSMVGALTGYERKVEASRRPVVAGYKPLHEGAVASHGARMRRKLTGKSTWFKQNKKDVVEESIPEKQSRGGGINDQTRRTNGKRKLDEEQAKGVKKMRKEQDGSNMETTSVMFVDCTPMGYSAPACRSVRITWGLLPIGE